MTQYSRTRTQRNTFWREQNGRHITDDISKCIFLKKNVCIFIQISPKFLPRVQSTICHHWIKQWLVAYSAKSHNLNQWWPSSLPHISITRPQYVNNMKHAHHWYRKYTSQVLCQQFPGGQCRFDWFDRGKWLYFNWTRLMAVSNDCTYAGVSRVLDLIYTYRFWFSIGTCSFPCDNSHHNNDVTEYLKNNSHGSNLFSVDYTFIFQCYYIQADDSTLVPLSIIFPSIASSSSSSLALVNSFLSPL